MDLLSEVELPSFVPDRSAENLQALLFEPSELRTELIEWFLAQAEEALRIPLFPQNPEVVSKIERLRLACVNLQVSPGHLILPFLQCNSVGQSTDVRIWEQLIILAHYSSHRNRGNFYSEDSAKLIDQVLKQDGFSKLRRAEVNFEPFFGGGSKKLVFFA